MEKEVVTTRRKKKRTSKKKARTYRLVPLNKCHANSCNPNEMDPQMFKKLKKGLRGLLDEAKETPPIVVRRSKVTPGTYEIIDGFHRWKALGELKEQKVGVFVIKVSDKTARVLTRTLNYVKGKANREKYAEGLVELLEMGASTVDLQELLPENADEIDELLAETRISIKAFEQLSAEEDEEEEKYPEGDDEYRGEDSVFVDLKFKVSVSQAKIIEGELSRIMGALGKGKNARGRALEMMAANSIDQPLPTH